MNRVIWRNEALSDLDAIVDYLERFDPAPATRYQAALRALGESLCEYPRRGRPASDAMRELTGVPPYILRYRIVDGDVHIVTIFHGRQNR